MRIYYTKLGGHIHCRVFMSGSMNGTLVFDEEEWDLLIRKDKWITFISDDET